MNDQTVRRELKWEQSGDTNVGMVRVANEDAILLRSEVGLWAVADGMGGHEVGDVASKMVVDSLQDVRLKGNLDEIVNQVEDQLISVNQEILDYAQTNFENKTVGSTIVVLLISGRVGVCLWVGDSRLYRYRKGNLEQMSRDHSRVEELIQQGLLIREDAENHPESNVITRAVGVSSDFCVDISAFDVQIGDTFLLCSDGLYNMLNQEHIKRYLDESDLDTKVSELIAAALKNGAPDNVSAIVVKGCFEKINSREVLINE